MILYGAGPHPSPPSDATVVSHKCAINVKDSEKGNGKSPATLSKQPPGPNNPPRPLPPAQATFSLPPSLPIPASSISLAVYTSPMPIRSTAPFDKHTTHPNYPLKHPIHNPQWRSHSVVTMLPITGAFTPCTPSPIKFVDVREILRSLSTRIPLGSVGMTPTKDGRGKENRKEVKEGRGRHDGDAI